MLGRSLILLTLIASCGERTAQRERSQGPQVATVATAAPVSKPAPSQIASVPCYEDGWCWESPAPHGGSYAAIWAASPDDAWLVGDAGISHWDGTRVLRASAIGTSLHGVFGTGPDDVWAWGEDDVLLHWDGRSWSSAAWSIQNPGFPGLRDIAGAWGSRGDVRFVAGPRGEIMRWDGQSWTLEPPLETPAFLRTPGPGYNLVGSAPGGYGWICTPVSVDIYRGRGRQFTKVSGASMDRFARCTQVIADSPDDVLITINREPPMHWDGKVLAPQRDAYPPWDAPLLFGRDRSWAAGAVGLLLHRPHPGDPWRKVNMAHGEDARLHYWAAWASSPADVWAIVLDGSVVRRDAAGWRTLAMPDSLPRRHSAIWGAAGKVWIAGEHGIVHGTEGAWTISKVPAQLNGIWGSAAATSNGPPALRIFAVGTAGAILSSQDGQSFTPMPSGTRASLEAVTGTRADDVWAVGERTILHFDGQRWKPVPQPGPAESWRAAWATPSGDLWIVGEQKVFRRHAATWTELTPKKEDYYYGIQGNSDQDLWLRGNDSRMYHWDGTQWTLSELAAGFSITAMAVSGSHVWVLGHHGEILARSTPLAAPQKRDSPKWQDKLIGPDPTLQTYCAGSRCVLHEDTETCRLPAGTKAGGPFLELRGYWADEPEGLNTPHEASCVVAVRVAAGWYTWDLLRGTSPEIFLPHLRRFDSVRVVGDRLVIRFTGVAYPAHGGPYYSKHGKVCGVGKSGDVSCTPTRRDLPVSSEIQPLDFP